MKTALTQLIEKWETERGSYIPNAPIYAAFIAEAKELLEAEKEQIMEAYRIGKYGIEFGKEFLDSDDYFTQTFKSEQ